MKIFSYSYKPLTTPQTTALSIFLFLYCQLLGNILYATFRGNDVTSFTSVVVTDCKAGIVIFTKL